MVASGKFSTTGLVACVELNIIHVHSTEVQLFKKNRNSELVGR